VIFVAGQGRDAIHGQQRRVPDRIQQRAQGGHIGTHGTGGVDMGDQDGADGMAFVRAQRRLDPVHFAAPTNR
jgi:hypothetical protein